MTEFLTEAFLFQKIPTTEKPIPCTTLSWRRWFENPKTFSCRSPLVPVPDTADRKRTAQDPSVPPGSLGSSSPRSRISATRLFLPDPGSRRIRKAHRIRLITRFLVMTSLKGSTGNLNAGLFWAVSAETFLTRTTDRLTREGYAGSCGLLEGSSVVMCMTCAGERCVLMIMIMGSAEREGELSCAEEYDKVFSLNIALFPQVWVLRVFGAAKFEFKVEILQFLGALSFFGFF